MKCKLRQQPRTSFFLVLGLCLNLVFLTNCTKKESQDFSQDLVSPLPDSTVILEFTNGKITVADVKDKVHPEFEKAREKLLNTYISAAEELLINQSADRINTKDLEVTELEAQNYIKANHLTKSTVEEIKVFLLNEKKRIQRQISKSDIFNQLEVKNKLGAARFDLGKTKDLPQQGESGADVTVQYFCDFVNPICARSRIMIQEIRTELPKNVRFVFRHFPVASHQFAKEAALYSICAHEKGKFWEMHDKLFDQQATINPDKMKVLARDIGLKDSETETCVKAPSTSQLLETEIKEAITLGISSTPVFYVNGLKVSEMEELKKIIKGKIQ